MDETLFKADFRTIGALGSGGPPLGVGAGGLLEPLYYNINIFLRVRLVIIESNQGYENLNVTLNSDANVKNTV